MATTTAVPNVDALDAIKMERDAIAKALRERIEEEHDLLVRNAELERELEAAKVGSKRKAPPRQRPSKRQKQTGEPSLRDNTTQLGKDPLTRPLFHEGVIFNVHYWSNPLLWVAMQVSEGTVIIRSNSKDTNGAKMFGFALRVYGKNQIAHLSDTNFI